LIHQKQKMLHRKNVDMKNTLLVFIVCMITASAYSQKKIDRQYYINLLHDGYYSRVFDECMTMRKGVYGKCAILDYFIAKSLCLDGYREKSQEWLKYVLDNYPLKTETRKFITTDINNCSAGNTGSALGAILTLPLPQASVSGMSKMGRIINCTDQTQLINWQNLFNENDLENRLFSTEQKDSALSKLQSLLGAKYKVNFLDRFIIVTVAEQNITDNQVATVTTLLQRAFDFYKNFYNLRAPDKLITVYLMPNQASLHNVALKIHGIDVGNATLGYSLLSDLSLLGISTPTQVGTLYHELFHLVVRTDAGDIPAWLDEGLASLYSIYQWKNDTLKGAATWRIEQLRPEYINSTGIGLPSLKELISYNWQDFNGGDDIDLCRASVNYALSNHFMIYLQEKGLLQSLVAQFKSRSTPGNKNDLAASDNISIVEKVCNAPIQTIQTDFENWFQKKYNFNLYGYKHDQYSELQMEHYYMMFEEIGSKTGSMLYNLSSQKNEKNKAFIDSAKKQLDTIHNKFTTLQGSYSNYKNSNKMEEFMVMVEELKKDLFALYNKVEAAIKQ